jgi:DNA-directed RNA polymerase specialized sigma24 family protein
MEPNSTDAELLASSVEEPALFAGLFERHGLAVRLYAMRRVGPGAGDDIASEVFIRAFHARGRLIREAPDLAEQHDAGLTPELVAALRGLPARERDTLLLVVWGEVTQDEAAAALGVPVGTVSSRITRARKRLTTALMARPSARATEVRLNGGADV